MPRHHRAFRLRLGLSLKVPFLLRNEIIALSLRILV